MPERMPRTAQPFGATVALPTPWAEARSRLEEAQFYWLATVRPDGRPHSVPVLAVWVDGALHLSAGPATRKAQHLAQDPRCVLTRPFVSDRLRHFRDPRQTRPLFLMFRCHGSKYHLMG